jgi:hypothetical protein
MRSNEEMTEADKKIYERLPKRNNNFQYILNIVDVFSRYAWSFGLKKKTGELVTNAFKQIFDAHKQNPDNKSFGIPKKLWVDRGKELYNKNLQTLLKQNNVIMYTTKSTNRKPSIVERFNRTLKEIMWKYFAQNDNLNWIGYFGNIINFYNNKYHLTLKMTPTEARMKENYNKVKSVMSQFSEFNNRNYHNKPKYKLGDKVRILLKQGMFTKGYKPKWSEEIYKINEIKYNGVWFYKVTNLNPDIFQALYNPNLPKEQQNLTPIKIYEHNLFYYENELIKVN